MTEHLVLKALRSSIKDVSRTLDWFITRIEAASAPATNTDHFFAEQTSNKAWVGQAIIVTTPSCKAVSERSGTNLK